MSSWNNRFKRLSDKKSEKLQQLIVDKGTDIWDEFIDEVYEKFDGRISAVYTDCIRGVIDFGDMHISETQFNEDCKEINKMLNNLLKKYLQN